MKQKKVVVLKDKSMAKARIDQKRIEMGFIPINEKEDKEEREKEKKTLKRKKQG